eukprot:8203501-Pyramimonas_sp.AAC.1
MYIDVNRIFARVYARAHSSPPPPPAQIPSDALPKTEGIGGCGSGAGEGDVPDRDDRLEDSPRL